MMQGVWIIDANNIEAVFVEKEEWHSEERI